MFIAGVAVNVHNGGIVESQGNTFLKVIHHIIFVGLYINSYFSVIFKYKKYIISLRLFYRIWHKHCVIATRLLFFYDQMHSYL